MHRIECPYEMALKEAGYVQVYDGQTAPQKGQQFDIKPEDRRFFVRHFRQVKHNRFTDKWATLKYDTREGYCIEVHMINRPPGLPKEEQVMITREDMLREGVVKY